MGCVAETISPPDDNIECTSGMANGMMIPMVPKLVPVENATMTESRNTRVGSSHSGRLLSRSSPR